MEDEKNWACEWHGARGGKWWTGYVTEEEARKKFEEIGEKGRAEVYTHFPPFIHHTEAKNKTHELLDQEKHLEKDLKRMKNLKKSMKELETSISSKRSDIRRLKKEITTINGKINRL